MKKKSSFSIDSLAKSAREEPTQRVGAGGPYGGQMGQNGSQIPTPFPTQHQELYRKAIENLKNSTNNGGVNPQHTQQHGKSFAPQNHQKSSHRLHRTLFLLTQKNN